MSTMDPQVELLEHTPDPARRVCTHARNDYNPGKLTEMSYEELMAPVDGDTLEEKEHSLIKKMMLRGHWGPLEHVYLNFFFRGSRSAMGQITRHRHATFDIQSMRYVDMSDLDPLDPDDFLFPPGVMEDSIKTREGVKEFHDRLDHGTHTTTERQHILESHYEDCLRCYRELREKGVPAEDARMALPIGTKVNMTMSLNLRSFLHILQMRGPDAGDAQKEIGVIAEQMKAKVEEACPVIMSVWNENKQAINRARLSP